MDVVLEARGLSGSEQNATKLSRELAEFVSDVCQTIAASIEAPHLAQLITNIEYLDEQVPVDVSTVYSRRLS